MNNEHIKILISAINNCGETPRSYSGRYMYGKDCLGVTCDNPLSFIINLVQELVEYMDIIGQDEFSSFLNKLNNINQDTMGMGSIIYWKDIPYTEEDS